MAKRVDKRKSSENANTAVELGFEAKFCLAADTLLPKLLFGAIRVSEAETFLETAV